MVRQSQIDGLLEASKHNLVAGFILNYRNVNNDTFFLLIDDFVDMINSINKKSFNVKDVKQYGGIEIENYKKRTRYTYNIEKLINETKL